LVDLKDRCQFAPRCPVAQEACLSGEPELIPLKDESTSHRSACLRAPEIHDRKIDGELMFKPPLLSDDVLADVPREDRKTTLAVNDLRKQFPLTKGALIKRKVGTVKAVDGITFDIREGECLAIVGESGCGKTTTLLEIMDLDPENGAVVLNGKDANGMSGSERREARKDIQIVFQDPMSSLNPRLTVREATAVGIVSRPLFQKAMAMPGSSRVRWGCTASTVRSSGVRPVPPEVRITAGFSAKAWSTAAAISASGTTRASGQSKPLRRRKSTAMGPERSS